MKFVIKEAWLLDENKKLKLKLIEKDDIPSLVEVEKVRGGYGKNDLSISNRINTLENIIKKFKDND